MEDKPEYSVRSLERVVIRMRDNTMTLSAWRMIADSARGAGTITMIDGADGVVFRGEGVFLGLSQPQLRATYDLLNTPSDEPTFETPQLG